MAQNSQNLGTFGVVLGKSEVFLRANYSQSREIWQKLDKIAPNLDKTR